MVFFVDINLFRRGDVSGLFALAFLFSRTDGIGIPALLAAEVECFSGRSVGRHKQEITGELIRVGRQGGRLVGKRDCRVLQSQ